MKNIFKTACFSGVFIACTASSFALVVSNYTGWQNDYDGTEAGTLYLYKFESPPTNSTTPNMAVGGPVKSMTVNLAGTTRGVTGKFGAGFQVNNPYSSTSTGAQLNTSGIFTLATSPYISVEVWYSTPNTSPGDGLNYLIDYQYNTNYGFKLYTDNASDGSDLRISVGNGTSNLIAVSSGLTWETNQFYHLAFTYNALEGELLLYRDGEIIAQAIDAEFGNIADYAGNLRLGDRAGSFYRNTPGVYDNFRVSDALYQYTAIPEPSTIALAFGIGALALGIIRKRQRN